MGTKDCVIIMENHSFNIDGTLTIRKYFFGDGDWRESKSNRGEQSSSKCSVTANRNRTEGQANRKGGSLTV